MAENCLFCGIGQGKVPAKKVYEDSSIVAFLDINPRNPGHTLVIPKKHAETIFEMTEGDVGKLFEAVRKVAESVRSGMTADGVNISQSNGQVAGQVVGHVHVHIIPRFANEGPIGLEGMLAVKRLDDKSLEQIAEKIKTAKVDEEQVEQFTLDEDEPDEKRKKKGKKRKEDEDEDVDDDDLEEISFDF